MKPPTSPSPAIRPAAAGASPAEKRARGIRRATLVAVATNGALSAGQIVIGLFAGAFSLVADAAHTLSDLVTDLLVLFAGRHGADPADRNHPYGHGRIETVATLLLGLVLAAVGLGFLWTSGLRLQDMPSSRRCIRRRWRWRCSRSWPRKVCSASRWPQRAG
jgi:divalent metal cation (Fe/Co/Zn/Cd) transporter